MAEPAAEAATGTDQHDQLQRTSIKVNTAAPGCWGLRRRCQEAAIRREGDAALPLELPANRSPAP